MLDIINPLHPFYLKFVNFHLFKFNYSARKIGFLHVNSTISGILRAKPTKGSVEYECVEFGVLKMVWYFKVLQPEQTTIFKFTNLVIMHMDDETLSYIDKEITLEVGYSTKIKLGFMNNFTLIYSGMPNKDVFSIGILSSSGNQGYGYNLFYPKNTKNIKVRNKTFRVVNVSPERLTII